MLSSDLLASVFESYEKNIHPVGKKMETEQKTAPETN